MSVMTGRGARGLAARWSRCVVSLFGTSRLHRPPDIVPTASLFRRCYSDDSQKQVFHVPVLAEEVISTLRPVVSDDRPAVIVDATFGDGGHTSMMLDRLGDNLTVHALDRDYEALTSDSALELKARYGDRLQLHHTRFSSMHRALNDQGVSQVDGILFDLGVSSRQLDCTERGFSFRADAELDMRMEGGNVKPDGVRAESLSALSLVNSMSRRELAETIAIFGEDRLYNRIAGLIVEARKEGPIETTTQLASIIESAYGGRSRPKSKGAPVIHPATRTFQALRILVNDEPWELARALPAAESLLRPGGRLVAISFHSGEDRQVKQFLRHCRSGGGEPSIDRVFPLTVPQKEETERNPRSRSAKMRAGQRSENETQGQNWRPQLPKNMEKRR
eukprot:TRINITY_DN5804_c0_g1_i1.p1 TRINITY_DN5804_c0_g1~~TRINITY_DN5804_c0_g1_i1.p1  ORF type:complete len:391 (-),score=36.40 TRINITY_DN5804_c0_g1_i1:66-1238(-)